MVYGADLESLLGGNVLVGSNPTTSAMNHASIIAELREKYPGKNIIENIEGAPTEIICEIDPTTDHPGYSVALAIKDKSAPHSHKVTTEKYEIIKGSLTLHIEDQVLLLQEGSTYTIEPNKTHWAIGSETWVRIESKPGWTKEDHILS